MLQAMTMQTNESCEFQKSKFNMFRRLTFGIKNIEYIIYFLFFPCFIIEHVLFNETKHFLLKPIKIFIGYFLIIPWIALAILILPILFIYKKLTELILGYRLGNKFVGLILGIDGVLTFYGEMGGTVNFASFIESNLDEKLFSESLHKRVRQISLSMDTPEKLKCVRKYFMGHLYFEKVNYISSKEIVNNFHLEENTQNGFLKKIDEIIMTKLPRDNSFNWGIHWCKFGENRETNGHTYIVILRIHHTLADAFGLYNIMSNILLKSESVKDDYAESFRVVKPESFKIKSKIKHFFNFMEKPTNFLFIPNTYCGGVHGHFVEKEAIFLKKISVIRKSVENTGVINVIATGFSAALSDFIKKKGLQGPYVPREILIVTPLQEKMDRMYDYYKNKFCSNLSNDFTYMPYKIPFKTASDMDIEDRFHKINQEIKEALDSCDRKLMYVLLKTYLEVIPNKLAKLSPKVICSGTIGMATGGPKLDFFNGGVVKNITVFVPALEANGLAFGLYSFDKKLSVSLAANGSKFSQEDVNEILENTFYNIDLLYNRFNTN